ncbi:MAG: HAMP domain-containing sensor histidine kinase [Cyanobacteria bacterium P01_A01_bin.123]
MTIHRRTSLSIRRTYQQLHKSWAQLRQTLFPTKPAAYIKWQQEFLHKRLGFGLWIGLICFLISAGHGLYIYLFEIDQIRADLDDFYGEPGLTNQFREISVIGFFVIVGLILICLFIQRTQWGKRHPALVFLIFASAVNGFATQIISTFYGIPIAPTSTVFLVFAVLAPLRWRLHLLAQMLPITYYTIVLPIVGFTEIGNRSVFDTVYSVGTFIELGLVCLICNAGVFVYEKLRLSEFESRRELQIFLHAISHDLRNPVMGTSVVIKSLLDKSVNGQVKISTPMLERLLQGSDRQLALINALIEAYHADAQGMTLHRQPLQLNTLVQTVLADVELKLMQNKVEIHNAIGSDLPLINADQTHMWRVLNNLIDNALKHNPPGIQLTLAAEVGKDVWRSAWQPNGLCAQPKRLPKPLRQKPSRLKSVPMLYCCVQDNGIGIPPDQCQQLFELYSRGKRARYMPGIGLGLYLCKQIITAHGGEIGVVSQPGKGSTFWFTLPLATPRAPSPPES